MLSLTVWYTYSAIVRWDIPPLVCNEISHGAVVRSFAARSLLLDRQLAGPFPSLPRELKDLY